jgi:hypothetical protein
MSTKIMTPTKIRRRQEPSTAESAESAEHAGWLSGLGGKELLATFVHIVE